MSEKFDLTPAQQAAAKDRICENIALMSGAGCGKTHVLARRFTELLVRDPEAENPLANFVALTFTDKAAVEMSQRVRKMLAERAAASHSTADRHKLLGWLQAMSEARISTIHSFCSSLLRSHAIEAGIDPNFALCADELIVEQMRIEAADQAILEAVAKPDREACEALGLIDYQRFVEHIANLIATRTAWKPADYADPETILTKWQHLRLTKIKEAYDELAGDKNFARRLDKLKSQPCSDPADKLAVHRDEQCDTLDKLLADIANWTPECFSQLKPSTRGGSKKNWGSQEQLSAARQDIKDVVTRLVDLSDFGEDFTELDARAATILATMTKLAVSANTIFTTAKRRRGMLDFTDLLEASHKLLAGNKSLQRAVAQQIDQLLVDEAQDTSGFQIELLELLMFGETGGSDLTDGKLFVVGDAKQSIYRFRGAQVKLFDDLCARLGRNKQEKLAKSFRTHAAGVEFINYLFAPLMGEDYSPIEAHRQDTPADESVEIILAGSIDGVVVTDAATATAAQAAATAQRIAEMVSGGERKACDRKSKTWRPVKYGDIAILFSRMTESLQYERQLAGRGIPYYVSGGIGFFQQQEVFDLLNALRVIDSPFDDIAFFGVLRSSLIGLDDNALMHIAEHISTPYLPKLIENCTVPGLGDEQANALRFAVETLSTLGRAKDALGVEGILRRLISETGYQAVLLAQPNGKQMLGNVRQLIQHATAANAEAMPLSDFVRQMSQQILSQSRYEQAGVSGEHENVVRIMTIHKAKGLEFPVVFLPDLNAGKLSSPDALLNRTDWGLTYKLQADDSQGEAEPDDTPLSYRLAVNAEKNDDAAENIRRFYVAATRHEDHLVLVGADWRSKAGTLRQPGSYLSKIDDILGIGSAIDAGQEQIAYAGGKFAARLRQVEATRADSAGRRKTIGGAMLAAAACGTDLARSIAQAGSAADGLPLIGPLPATTGEVELAVTALGQFAQCPMLYRWQYELRVPRAGKTGGDGPAMHFDAATLGTIFHRCMELLDFASPQQASALVSQTLSEMELDNSAAGQITADLERMLATFGEHDLHGRIASARQVFRELDFTMQAGPAMLRGQIDLLFQDAAGNWRIVDYKSDRVGGDDLSDKAAHYEMQMLIYAMAAGRHTGELPAEATLYFLRPGRTHTFSIDSEAIESASAKIAALALQLITARRAGSFAVRTGEKCEFCSYTELCQAI